MSTTTQKRHLCSIPDCVEPAEYQTQDGKAFVLLCDNHAPAVKADQLTSEADMSLAFQLASNPSQLHSLRTYQIRGGGSAWTHLNVLESALSRGEPVNASYVVDHGGKLPSGYTQRGAILFPPVSHLKNP